MRLLTVGLLLALACLPPRARAQTPTRDWRPEDRAIIGDFSHITSVATAIDRVYVTSTAAALIWNPQFKQWRGPFDPPDAGLLARVFGALVDPLDNSLWLARPDGWVHFQPELQVWDHGPVPEGVQAIAFDGDDPTTGLYLRSRAGWLLLPRGGLIASPARPPAHPTTPARIDDVLRSNPTLQTNAAQFLLDARLNPARLTAAARSVDNLGWYIGTWGVGLLYLPDGAALPDRLTYGLRSPMVGAVFGWPDGVWAATNRTPQTDATLTFVARELDAFRTLEGLPASGLPFTQVRKLAGQGSALWAATDQGLARIGTGDGRVQLLDEARGLPDSRVYAVVSRQGRITAGTRRGLVRVDDSLRVERVAPRFADAALAVFPTGDSVWVGTPRGLLLAVPGQQDLVRPGALASPSLQAPVVALGALGDTVVALTRDEMLWRDPRTGAWTLGPNLSGLLGGLVGFIADGPGFWVAGDRGVAFARLTTPPIRPLRDGDLPGSASDLAVDRDYLWVATDGGLVRFRLDAIRP
jgi:ligand-binding sensor domain-containing protein